MELQLSFRDMSWYYEIPYDLYDQDPEKWGKLIKILILKKNTIDFQNVCDQMKKIISKHISTSSPLNWHNISASIYDNDYTSDKNVIISYKAGSGGNFLKSCLYFSDSLSCVTSPFFITSRSTDILVSTLDNIEEKLNYIISETKNQSVWIDPEIILNCKLLDNQILITMLHGDSIKKTLLDGLKIYPNCKTFIYYKNTRLFKYLREYENYCIWGNNHSMNKKKTISILQFIKKSQKTKKKLIDLYNDTTKVYSHCHINSKITFYVWDTNWYFSERDTIDHIKELYELLSLSGFNENAISKYYNVWIKTLDDLKTKSLNETT